MFYDIYEAFAYTNAGTQNSTASRPTRLSEDYAYVKIAEAECDACRVSFWVQCGLLLALLLLHKRQFITGCWLSAPKHDLSKIHFLSYTRSFDDFKRIGADSFRHPVTPVPFRFSYEMAECTPRIFIRFWCFAKVRCRAMTDALTFALAYACAGGLWATLRTLQEAEQVVYATNDGEDLSVAFRQDPGPGDRPHTLKHPRILGGPNSKFEGWKPLFDNYTPYDTAIKEEMYSDAGKSSRQVFCCASLNNIEPLGGSHHAHKILSWNVGFAVELVDTFSSLPAFMLVFFVNSALKRNYQLHDLMFSMQGRLHDIAVCLTGSWTRGGDNEEAMVITAAEFCIFTVLAYVVALSVRARRVVWILPSSLVRRMFAEGGLEALPLFERCPLLVDFGSVLLSVWRRGTRSSRAHQPTSFEGAPPAARRSIPRQNLLCGYRLDPSTPTQLFEARRDRFKYAFPPYTQIDGFPWRERCYRRRDGHAASVHDERNDGAACLL